MNWARGLWRLWVVTTVLWIVFWLWWRDVPCTWGFTYFGAKIWCGDPVVAIPPGYWLDMPWNTFPLMFGVPILVLGLAYVVTWIAVGFRRNSNG